MARSVAEIMNRELVVVGPGASASAIARLMRDYAIANVPVVDEARQPVGLVTARALLDDGGTAGERMIRPVTCVDAATDIADAARRFAEEDSHPFVVVDAAGAAIGVVSVLDVLRALLGIPARHPETFPHWDPQTHASWTDDWPLDDAHTARAPDAPGVLALVTDELGQSCAIQWVEACDNVRRRVEALATGASAAGQISQLIAAGSLSFRAATVPDDVDRERLARRLRDDLEHRPPPGAT
jgi:CBS domain-containing protein